MPEQGRHIVVVGTSAGGLDALDALISQLPALPASIFIVQHLAPESSGMAMLTRFSRYPALNWKFAEDGEIFVTGQGYIAPPDGRCS